LKAAWVTGSAALALINEAGRAFRVVPVDDGPHPRHRVAGQSGDRRDMMALGDKPDHLPVAAFDWRGRDVLVPQWKGAGQP
jgi:hypothetical protein